jgi:hypothetical protein
MMKLPSFAAAFFGGFVLTSSAFAQSSVILMPNPLGPSTSDTAVTVTSTHAAAVPAGRYGFVEFSSQDPAATIRCKWGGTSVAADTAGQRTFLPYSGYIWDATDPPPANQVLDCISSTSSAVATVRFY